MTFNPPIYGADVNGSLYDPVSWRFLEVVAAVNILNRCVCELIHYWTLWWFITTKSHVLILCFLIHFCRMSKTGTFATWTLSWILWNMKAGSLLRGLIHPTCILACGRPPLHGTLRTWTSTVSTTYTLESPNRGKDTKRSYEIVMIILLLAGCSITEPIHYLHLPIPADRKQRPVTLIWTGGRLLLPHTGRQPVVPTSISTLMQREKVWWDVWWFGPMMRISDL